MRRVHHGATTYDRCWAIGFVIWPIVAAFGTLATELHAAEPAVETRTDKPDANDRERKRTVAEVAMYIVGGIAVVGVTLIVGVLVWGARIRRRAKNDRLEPQPHDPLWYLKTKKRNRPRASSPPEPPDATSG